LGDKDEFLPTNHGFDEFFGFLYHLNALEEPELPDYPPAAEYPNFKKIYGPRGVLDCQANPDGTQSIHDTGPLNKKRMETIDDEVLAKTEDFLGRQATSGTPFSYGSTARTCIYARIRPPQNSLLPGYLDIKGHGIAAETLFPE
jgi:arylsulfatase A-like enzyme